MTSVSRRVILPCALGAMFLLLAAGYISKAQQPVSSPETEAAASIAADKQPPPSSAYAGDVACRSCHTQASSYVGTAHHLTSRMPTAQSIGGNFSPGSNVFQTANPRLTFEMDASPAGFFETAKYTH